MAIAHVQTVTTGQTTSPLDVTLTTTAGNLVVLCCMDDGAQPGSLSITDNTFGNTVTQVINSDLNSQWTRISVVHNVTGGATTYRMSRASGTEQWRMWALEFSGLLTASAQDVSVARASGTDAGPTFTVGPTGTLGQADEVIVAIVNLDGSAANYSSNNNGFTVNAQTGVNGQGLALHKIVSSTATVSVDVTMSDTISGRWVLATFKAAATATDQYPPRNRYISLPTPIQTALYG